MSDTYTAPTHIRWMIRRDMPEVLAIEGNKLFPWVEEDFLRCLRQRNCIGMVAESGDKVIGFMIYELHKAKLHVLNFRVDAGQVFTDIAQQMICKLINKLSSHRRNKIVYNVREDDLKMLVFLRDGFEFSAVKVLRGFNEEDGTDAYKMVYYVPVAEAA